MESVLEQIKTLEEQPYLTEVNGTQVLALPAGWRSEVLSDLRETPDRVKENISFTSLSSFIEYVNRHKYEQTSIVKASIVNESGLSVAAIIDYHVPPAGEFGNGPRWCNHKASFSTTSTPAWKAWRQSNVSWTSQSAFADFLYQNQAEIKVPTGAALLEVIQTLKATAKGEFRDMKDLHTGSHELVYRMKVTAKGGTTEKPLELPQQFTVELVPFYGGPSVTFTADLLIRVPKEDGDPVMMCYRLYRTADVFHVLFEEIVDQLKEETALPVYLC